MYVLRRDISPYSGPALFLGVFTGEGVAQQARDAYLLSVSVNDPWRDQAYRIAEVELDVVVEAIDDRRSDMESGKGYMVTDYFDEMGMIRRRFVAIYSDRRSAELFAEERENLDMNDPATPNYCEVDEVLFDLRR